MGKETKIGLAVIGMLLSIFGVLLFRYFAASHPASSGVEEARAPIEPLSSDGMAEPNVVVASPEPGGIRSKLWDDQQEPDVATVDQAPTASYMPDQPQADAELPRDPYANPGEPSQPDLGLAPQVSVSQPSETEEGQPEFSAESTPSAGPFDRQSGEPVDMVMKTEPAQVSEEGAFELPQANPSQSGNPLRRLSAQEPIDTAQGSSTTVASEMELPAADPYASGTTATQAPTMPRRDPFDNADGDAATAPGGRDPFGSQEASSSEAEQILPGDSKQVESFGAIDSAQRTTSASQAEESGSAFDRYESEPEPSATAEAATEGQRSAFDRSESGPRTAADDWQTSTSTAQLGAMTADSEPLPVENGMYTVQPGDTLWSISEKVYGTGGFFKALAARNRSSLPRSDKLTVGSQVAVPPSEELERDFPSLCPKQRKSALVQPRSLPPAAAQRRADDDVYIVAEGDTLFDIARYELGKASRWAEIYQLNRDILGEDFDYLRPGTELVMPAREQTATRPAGSRY